MIRVPAGPSGAVPSPFLLMTGLAISLLAWSAVVPRTSVAEPLSETDLVTIAVVEATPFHPDAGSPAFARPTSNALFQFQKDNRRHPWLRITSDSGRIERKVLRFDSIGLHELSAPDGSRTPGPLVWSRIRRIDEVVTRAGPWKTVGAVTAGLLGAAINVDEGGGMTLVGLVAFGGAGAWVGDRFGSRLRSERNWYVADTTRREEPKAIAATTVFPSVPGVDTAGVGLTETTASPSVPVADAAILRACDRIRRNELFRAYGSFGSFQGRAGIVGPEGIEDLRARRQERTLDAELPQRIRWDQVDRIDVRGGSALQGALAGGAGFAAFGALLGTAVIAVSGNSDVSVGEGAIVGALYLAPVGIVLGGLGGAAVRRWVPVYRRK